MNYYDVPLYNYETFNERENENNYEGLIDSDETISELF